MGVEPGVVQRYLDGNASLFDRWQVDTRKLSRHTLDQVLNLAMKGDVLIRGWGAAALFQGIRGVLCVRGMRADGGARARHGATGRHEGCRSAAGN
jgi:hypothetical protein